MNIKSFFKYRFVILVLSGKITPVLKSLDVSELTPLSESLFSPTLIYQLNLIRINHYILIRILYNCEI